MVYGENLVDAVLLMFMCCSVFNDCVLLFYCVCLFYVFMRLLFICYFMGEPGRLARLGFRRSGKAEAGSK